MKATWRFRVGCLPVWPGYLVPDSVKAGNSHRAIYLFSLQGHNTHESRKLFILTRILNIQLYLKRTFKSSWMWLFTEPRELAVSILISYTWLPFVFYPRYHFSMDSFHHHLVSGRRIWQKLTRALPYSCTKMSLTWSTAICRFLCHAQHVSTSMALFLPFTRTNLSTVTPRNMI